MLALVLLAGCASPPKEKNRVWPQLTLVPAQVWQLNPPRPGPFDASGLAWDLPHRRLLTVDNQQHGVFQVLWTNSPVTANLVRARDLFTDAQMATLPFPPGTRFDLEGLAFDEAGALYLCEEATRSIFKFDPRSGKMERLPIDWTPVARFFSTDKNASFEGLAVGHGRLYVANERGVALIIVIDLKTLKVVDHFQAAPRSFSLLGTHYSDLAWFDNRLFILCRQHRAVIEVDPKSHEVAAEYDYKAAEEALEYHSRLPISVGIMEGLAVDKENFWLVTDNNGWSRGKDPSDVRPTLLRCPRPVKH